jgi:hypothetical protein
VLEIEKTDNVMRSLDGQSIVARKEEVNQQQSLGELLYLSIGEEPVKPNFNVIFEESMKGTSNNGAQPSLASWEMRSKMYDCRMYVCHPDVIEKCAENFDMVRMQY